MKTNKVKVFFKGLTVLTLIGLIFSSCSSSSDTVTPSTGTAFAEATMKPWFDTYCSSCHASGKSNYKDWLYNPANYETSIKANISKLYSEVYTRKSMPEGTKLSTAELAKFKAWYDAGYPAK